ncbi:MAG: hypothetical protein WKF77_15765 [Planctomycetaceae bacterium]
MLSFLVSVGCFLTVFRVERLLEAEVASSFAMILAVLAIRFAFPTSVAAFGRQAIPST